MPLTITTGSAIQALTENQFAHWAEGDAWESGCEVTLASDPDDITVDVASGAVYVASNKISVSAQSKSLQDGDPQHPRKDVVCVDSNGAVQVLAGTPAEPVSDVSNAPGYDPIYDTYRPAPDELDGEGGQLVPLAEIWVPPDTTASNDLDGSITYVRDRRLKNPINTLPAAYTDEQAVDAVAVALASGSDINITYDDAADEILFEWTGTTGTDTHASISDDGTEVVADVSDVNFGTAVGASADGDGSVTVNVSGVGPSELDTTQTFNFPSGNLQEDGATVRTYDDLSGETVNEPMADTFAVAAGDSYVIPVFVPDGSTVTVYAWGLNLTDGSTDSNVTLDLLDPSGTSQGSIAASSAPAYAQNFGGIASYSNASGGPTVAHLDLANTGSTDYTPGGAGVGIELTVSYRLL